MKTRLVLLATATWIAAAAAACGDDATPANPTAVPTVDGGADTSAPLPSGDAGTQDSATTGDGASPGAAFSKRFGEASAKEIEGAKAVATDAAGNIVVVGEIWGAADFGGGVLKTAGGQDIFVAKFDPTGKHLWSQRVGDAGKYQVALAVAVDTDGNVAVAGEFDGTINFGSDASTELKASPTGGDVFVAKLDPSGKHLWSLRAGDDADGQTARSVTFDKDGNVLLAGQFAGVLDFGKNPLTASGGADAFVAKFDKAGAHTWSHRYGGDGKTTAAAVRTDAAGNVVLVGDFAFTVDFTGAGVDAGAGLTSQGGSDVFVVKLDKDGKHVWSKAFGGAAKRQAGEGLAIDGAGNLLVASTFEGTISFNGPDAGLVDPGYPTFGASNVAIAKLTPSGEHVWSKAFGDAARQFVRGAVFDRDGNVVIAGQFTGAIDFGGGPLNSPAKSLFIAKFDPNGGHVWSRKFGDTGEVSPDGLTTDSAKNVIFAGRFAGKADFGGGPLTTADGDYDVVIAKLAP